jgi:hypothetical protein
VLKFDDNDVDCETDDEIVVFVRVGDVFDERDCGGVGEVEIDIGVIGEDELEQLTLQSEQISSSDVQFTTSKPVSKLLLKSNAHRLTYNYNWNKWENIELEDSYNLNYHNNQNNYNNLL